MRVLHGDYNTSKLLFEQRAADKQELEADNAEPNPRWMRKSATQHCNLGFGQQDG